MTWLDDRAKRRLRHALAIIRWAYAPLVLVFLAYAAYRTSDVVVPMLRHARLRLLLAAALVWASLHLVTPIFSWVVMRDLGAALGYREALKIHVSRLPAKYLPGGIWHTISRMGDFHRAGIGRPLLVRLALLENTVPVGVASLLGGCLTSVAEPRLGLTAAVGGIALLGLIFLFLRDRQGGQAGITLRGFSAALVASIGFWILASLAFTCYWAAYAGIGGTIPTQVPGAYMLAWAAGFVALFAPQGMGVFETTIGLLLKGAIPLAGTALIAAGFRVVILAADLSAFCVLQLLNPRSGPATVIDRS